MKKLHGTVLIGVAVLALAACGSSNDEAPVPPPPSTASTDIPSSATGSAAGLLTYQTTQVGSTSDTAEPVLVGDAVLPVDDTTETSL